MLRVTGLGKRFGERWLFRGLEFGVGLGECLIVVGPNGSGKSTLLRTISGLLPPTEGKVKIEGDERLALGVSSIEMSLYPQLSVVEHLELAADLRDCESRCDELIEQIGLASARDLPAAKLSTGMKSRVKLAMAIQARPKLLVLDEPGAALDEKGRALVEQIVKDQMTRGAVLIATNDPTERRLGTHELVMAS